LEPLPKCDIGTDEEFVVDRAVRRECRLSEGRRVAVGSNYEGLESS
jgi:hypothetical protein